MEKSLVFDKCMYEVEEKIEKSKNILRDIELASQSESKSSAGDKFETSREMLKQEAEKAEVQLSRLLLLRSELNRLKPITRLPFIERGALVRTDKGIFYISAAIGKIKVESETVFAISVESPMAIKLMGKKADESINVNGRKIIIHDVT